MNSWYMDTDTKNVINIYDEKELSNAVYNTIQYYKDLSQRLMDENTTLLKEAKQMVDKQLQEENERLKERLMLSYGEFSSIKEMTAYEQFMKRHMHDRLTSKANSGRAPYLIPTGTGIGTILHVKCPICGIEKDITDTEVW